MGAPRRAAPPPNYPPATPINPRTPRRDPARRLRWTRPPKSRSRGRPPEWAGPSGAARRGLGVAEAGVRCRGRAAAGAASGVVSAARALSRSYLRHTPPCAAANRRRPDPAHGAPSPAPPTTAPADGIGHGHAARPVPPRPRPQGGLLANARRGSVYRLSAVAWRAKNASLDPWLARDAGPARQNGRCRVAQVRRRRGVPACGCISRSERARGGEGGEAATRGAVSAAARGARCGAAPLISPPPPPPAPGAKARWP